MILGEFAVAKGCLARAQTLLNHTTNSPERGWVASTVGMFEGDRTRNEQYFNDALAIARQMSDVELELVTVSYLGASLVHAERTEEGMLLSTRRLLRSPATRSRLFVLEEVFCQLFSAREQPMTCAGRTSGFASATPTPRSGTFLRCRRSAGLTTAAC